MTNQAPSPARRRHPGAAAVALAIAVLGARPAAAQSTPASPDSMAPAVAESAVTPVIADSIAAAPQTPVQANPRSAAIRKVRLNRHSHNVVRSGPGNQYSIAGVYPEGSVFPVIAKSGDWYDIRLSASETGWIHASLCKEFDDLSDLELRPNPRLFNRTGTYILTGYGGAYAYDRKSNSAVYGGRLGYYVFDRLQFEGGVAWTHVRRPAEIVESLFGLSLEAESFDMLFYNMNATWELLPGRQMVPYLSAGAGSSLMQGTSEPGFNFGAGTTLFLSKRSAMRWEFRSYRFHSGPADARVSNNNVEFTLGTSLLF
jgi:outer membrane beta-barrel protein